MELDWIQEDKNYPDKLKKVNKLFFLSAGCSLLMVDGFSCSLTSFMRTRDK